MIDRQIKQKVETALSRQAAVAIIGPRQVGKTTLARKIAEERPSVYLDLEAAKDRSKLDDPVLFLEQHSEELVILDEIHRKPEIFQELRGIIDERRRKGFRTGQFLILGSAAIDLLKQSSETLAGRIEYVNLSPLNLSEIGDHKENTKKLWLRGGFPDSFLASNEENSFSLRESFIRTYLERDVPMFNPRIPAESLRRLWTMLAHNQGGLLNLSKLSSSVAVSSPTIASYVDLLVDLLLVRRLPPFLANVGKRLVKSPKTYVRDSGLLHTLLNIETMDELMGHPVKGSSWEGFVIENILASVSSRIKASFYRTSAGAEIDLVLDFGPQKGTWAIEIKLNLAPKIEKGFRNALDDLKPKKAFIVYPGEDRYPKSSTIDVLNLSAMMSELSRT